MSSPLRLTESAPVRSDQQLRLQWKFRYGVGTLTRKPSNRLNEMSGDSGMLPLCLTDHTGAFAFDQGVVVAFPEPGFGWFDVQFFEQTGHLALDAFRAGAF